MYIYIHIYHYIYIYTYINVPVTLLVYFKNTHRKIFLRVSPRCPLLITDHIFGISRKVISKVSRHKF